jgi:hypothetical protein
VDCCLILAYSPGVDKSLDVRVVVGDLREFTFAKEIRTGISHVHHGCAITMPEKAGDSGAHTGEIRLHGDHVCNSFTHINDGFVERAQHVFLARRIHVEISHGGNRDSTCEFTGGMSAHAIGDQEKRRAGITGVLVSFAHETDV